MKRAWPAILAAAALDYASAYYRGTMTRLLWPKWEPLTPTSHGRARPASSG